MMNLRHAIALGVLLCGCASARVGAEESAAAPKYTNRLAKEKSPYLRQHAHNPVDWYPWGDEAFAKAKKEGKPIFLSIGYSTCHWCHVMERESFEDEAVAKLINEGFVPVKVDREERPDVDRVYMTFLTAVSGSGGWPMTIVVTPEGKPFFGGTYFPPEPARGLPGLKEVLARVRDAWTNQRDKVNESADEVARGLSEIGKANAPNGEAALDAALLDRTVRKLVTRFDDKDGGFGLAPKFPEPPTLAFLLRRGMLGERASGEMAVQTLAAVRTGGIHDHLGGGFHRYSTDGQWFLPHFEKMLYDQAQLASVYVDAYRLTRDPAMADAARDTLDYVLRDLTGDDGKFFSAEDADSAPDASEPTEKREGAFYVWTADEIAKALPGPGRAAEAARFYFGVEADGNVKRDPHGEFAKQNVLFLSKRTVTETATKLGLAEADTRALLDEAKAVLLAVRGKRARPHRDAKTIVAWNGLMISALAKAGPAFNEPRYTAAAARAAEFIAAHLWDVDAKKLHRVWLDGRSPVDGFLDDYAFYVQGLLDLYESTLELKWLNLAIAVQSAQDAKFEDQAAGGYFTTPADGDARLLYRAKDDAEGVEPSGGGVAAMNLLRLSHMLDDEPMRKRAERTLKGLVPRLQASADSMPSVLSAIEFQLAKPQQIVIAGDPSAADTKAMLAVVVAEAGPNRVILFADGGAGQAFLGDHAEFIRTMKPLDGKATAYVCENYACRRPTSDLSVLKELLKK